MKKKLLSVLLCLAMAVTMITGCGETEEPLDPETQAMVDKAISDPEYAPVPKESMKVGVIHRFRIFLCTRSGNYWNAKGNRTYG